MGLTRGMDGLWKGRKAWDLGYSGAESFTSNSWEPWKAQSNWKRAGLSSRKESVASTPI